ncbi:hypothetical protein B0H10DRAFT_2135092 [Mycena sp. CBHHK59/15]|nr:hypothetical protein B0H10DRAFT_2135092 [Mycena sp. CBHHK59/15]
MQPTARAGHVLAGHNLVVVVAVMLHQIFSKIKWPDERRRTLVGCEEEEGAGGCCGDSSVGGHERRGSRATLGDDLKAASCSESLDDKGRLAGPEHVGLLN